MTEHDSPCGELQAAQQVLRMLEEWQRSQNGTIQRMHQDINRRFETMNEADARRFDGLNGTLRQLLITALVSAGSVITALGVIILRG